MFIVGLPALLASSLPAAFLAAALAFILWTFRDVFGPAIARLLGAVPFIGGALANVLGSAISGVVSWATGWARTGLDGLTQLLAVPVQAVNAVVADITNGIEATAAGIVYIWSQLYNLAGAIASAGVNAAQALYQLATQVPALISATVAFLERWASNAIAVAVAPIHALVNGVTTLVHALVDQEAGVRHQEDQSILGQLAGQAVALQRSFAAAIGATAGTLTGDIEGLGVKVDQLEGVLAPALAIGGLGVLVTEVTETLRFTRECGQPMCNALGNGLDAFQGLSTLALMGAVGAMVAEAVHDPEGAARVTAGAVGGIHDLAAGLLGEFAGIGT